MLFEARTAVPPPRAPERHLVAQFPAQAPLYAELSLVVRITTDSAVPGAVLASLPPLEMGPDGAVVTVVVQAPAALFPLTDLQQVIKVPVTGEPAPVRFGFHARAPGLQRVIVTAWAGGTFLAELALEVSVQHGAPYLTGPVRDTPVGAIHADPGEVTLQVRFDGERYMFQLLSAQDFFEPVLAEAVTAQPSQAVERIIATLRSMALGGAQAKYSPENSRTWMVQAGIGLWTELVPRLIQDQFWQVRAHIASFTIAAGRDVIPWELLYPLPGDDQGFLTEQFPVLRRVYGQRRFPEVGLRDIRYVTSSEPPANTRDEITAIQRILRQQDGAGDPLRQLHVLLNLIESGDSGALHFVCHNVFKPDTGSAIALEGGPFVPELLNKAAALKAMSGVHPLVFINACRSSGAIPEYTQMMGWAKQFMQAGAGAFVGTSWAVRSESASTFAAAFYSALMSGEPLGQAALAARLEAARDSTDPTWLAYTVYGDPHARAVTG